MSTPVTPHGFNVEKITGGGGPHCDYHACFDQANKFIFVADEKFVGKFAIDTGHRVLNFMHDHEVVSMGLSPVNHLQLLTCTRVAVVTLWDHEDGARLKVVDLPDADDACLVYLLPIKSDINLLIVSHGQGDENGTHLYHHRISKTGVVLENRRVVKKVPAESALMAVHSTGSFVAHIRRDTLVITPISIKSGVSGRPDTKLVDPVEHMIGSRHKFRVVTCHPVDHVVATGDTSGKIFIWHNIFSYEPHRSVLHWHAVPVRALAFAPEGTSLYSGAAEMVLVKWSVKARGNNSKQFLPRLKSAIRRVNVSPDGSMLAVQLADNGINIVSSQRDIVKVIRGMVYRDHEGIGLPKLAAPCFVIDRWGLGGADTKGSLIMNGSVGELQFYSVSEKRHLYGLQVVSQNLPPATVVGQHLTATDVTLVAACADWLATVEARDDREGLLSELSLKLWTFDRSEHTFVLNTYIEWPHEESVTDMCFHVKTKVSKVQLVTCGSDGKFKIWGLQAKSLDDDKSKKVSWFCERAGYFRQYPACALAVSSHTSTLAVAFNTIVTLWDFYSLELIAPLVVRKGADDQLDDVRSMKFGVKSSVSVLLVSYGSCLIAWNEKSLEALWKLTSPISCFCIDPLSGLAAVSVMNTVYYIEPYTGAIKHEVSGSRKWNVTAVVFGSCGVVAGSGSDAIADLYFFNRNQTLYRIAQANQVQLSTTQAPQLTILGEKSSFGLANVLANAKPLERQLDMNPVQRLIKPMGQLLEGAVHTLPSLSLIAPNFLDSCLADRTRDLDVMEEDPMSYDSSGKPQTVYDQSVGDTEESSMGYMSTSEYDLDDEKDDDNDDVTKTPKTDETNDTSMNSSMKRKRRRSRHGGGHVTEKRKPPVNFMNELDALFLKINLNNDATAAKRLAKVESPIKIPRSRKISKNEDACQDGQSGSAQKSPDKNTTKMTTSPVAKRSSVKSPQVDDAASPDSPLRAVRGQSVSSNHHQNENDFSAERSPQRSSVDQRVSGNESSPSSCKSTSSRKSKSPAGIKLSNLVTPVATANDNIQIQPNPDGNNSNETSGDEHLIRSPKSVSPKKVPAGVRKSAMTAFGLDSSWDGDADEAVRRSPRKRVKLTDSAKKTP